MLVKCKQPKVRYKIKNKANIDEKQNFPKITSTQWKGPIYKRRIENINKKSANKNILKKK